MKYIKNILVITLIQIISWVSFTLFDFIFESLRIDHFGFYLIIIAISQILLLIFYFLKEKALYNNLKMSKAKFRVISFLTWEIESVILGYIICNLVEYNKWIVYQHIGGVLDFNGFEYYIFAFALGIVPIIILIIKILIMIYRKIMKYKGEIDNG